MDQKAIVLAYWLRQGIVTFPPSALDALLEVPEDMDGSGKGMPLLRHPAQQIRLPVVVRGEVRLCP